MKFLILFLITFNAFAEWKIEITNSDGQPMSKSGFITEADADTYILSLKHMWGEDQGWYREICDSPIGTREVEELGEMVTEYHCNATYSVTKSDITAQRDDEAIQDKIAQNGACGLAVRDHIGFLNIKNSIDPLSVMALSPSLINLLLAGTMDTARAVVVAIDPTQTVVIDQVYKDSVLAKIDSCKVIW